MDITLNNDIQEDSLYLIYTPTISSLPFTATGVGHFKSNSEYEVERDKLGMFLIFSVLDGCGTITYNNRSVNVTSGQAFIINGEKYHHYHTSSSSGHWEFKWLRFIGDQVDFYEEYINSDSLHIFDFKDLSLAKNIDTVIHVIQSNQNMKDIILSHHISSILTFLCKQKADTRNISGNASQLMTRAKDYLDKNYKQTITIEALAKELFINHYTLIRQFKAQYSISPYAYLITVRIHHSKYLLEQSFTPIHEISEIIGFNNVNNFIYNFKKITGMTPRHYRNHFK